MLRYAFLKSDFHPQILMLGEAADFSALSDLLRDFAENPREIAVPRAIGEAPETDAMLKMQFDPDSPGIRMPEDGKCFYWKLNQQTAAHFAELTANVAREESASSSEILEIGGDLREIPVKLSRGEFEDDFLISKS